jgi:hypothetical protein
MADASAGDGREDEEPNESPFERHYPRWLRAFPLWDENGNRNFNLGDAPTPAWIIKEINLAIEAAGAKSGMFYHDAWQALFKDCEEPGVPDIHNLADRFVAVVFLRYHFIIKDDNSEEQVYENGNMRYGPRTLNKLKTLVPQAQVSAIAMCLL